MKRILVLGPGGAGKSTVSQQMGAILGINVIHLDAIYWRPGWKRPKQSEWQILLSELVEEEAWIMDGNYSESLGTRLMRADTVVYLDIPRLVCFWRALKRIILSKRGKKQTEIAPGCPERLELGFLFRRLTHHGKWRRQVYSHIRCWPKSIKVIIVRNEREIEDFLGSLHVSSDRTFA